MPFFLPSSVQKLITKQTKQFNIPDRVLEAIINELIKDHNTDSNALNIIRHHVNQQGIAPYDQLWQPIDQLLKEKYYGRPVHSKAVKIAHQMYQNEINNIIYSHTVQYMCSKNRPYAKVWE